MSYRLTNEKDPGITIGLSEATWFGILDLAELYGWRPMGTVDADWWFELDESGECCGSYTSGEPCVVLWDDALNLADALEQAFMEYEPRPTRRTVSVSGHISIYPLEVDLPSIGAILGVADLCRQGEFCIEQF